MKTSTSRTLFEADSVASSLRVSTLAAIGQRGLGLIRGIALAALMPMDEYGLLGVAILVANLLMPACSAGLYDGIARYAPHYESKGTLPRFVARAGGLALAIALVTTGLLFVFADQLAGTLFATARISGGAATSATSPPTLLRMAVLCVATLVPYHAVLGLLKGLRMFRAIALLEMVAAVLFTVLALVGAATSFGTARAMMGAYAVSNVVAVALVLPGLLRRLSDRRESSTVETKPPESTLVRYSLWAAATTIVWHALSYYPMWHLLKIADAETAGVFRAMRLITQFLHIGGVMVIGVIAAGATRRWEHQGREAALVQLVPLTKASVIVLLAGATVLSLIKPLMMRLFADSFQIGEPAYDPLLLFYLMVVLTGLLTIRINLIEKPRLVFVAWFVGAAVSLAICLALLGSPFNPPDASHQAPLSAAAWSGVAGVAAALIVLAVLLAKERFSPDPRTSLLCLLALSAGWGWVVSLPVVAAIIALSFRGSLLFTSEERQTLVAGLKQLMVR